MHNQPYLDINLQGIHTQTPQKWWTTTIRYICLSLLILFLCSCGGSVGNEGSDGASDETTGESGFPQLPSTLPDLSDIPGIPKTLQEFSQEIPDLLNELELPNIDQLTNLPQIEDLPFLQPEEGTITYNGPVERRVNPGEWIPGTDLFFVGVTADKKAEFQIAGFNSTRSVGDSLDFDGSWGNVASKSARNGSGIEYSLRLRIYRIADDHVRAAGVHQLKVGSIDPLFDSYAFPEAETQPNNTQFSFPFTVNVARGEAISGTTYGYQGKTERGGEIFGLPSNAYPFHKTGDSIEWTGYLRHNLPVEYNLRMLYYAEEHAQVGGIVRIILPAILTGNG
ncbi:MAG: hypothetical protein AAF639_40080 [Chloroflexota bacterium]